MTIYGYACQAINALIKGDTLIVIRLDRLVALPRISSTRSMPLPKKSARFKSLADAWGGRDHPGRPAWY
jgi:DNA invertase Pin-like site-specific DNA recombinase